MKKKSVHGILDKGFIWFYTVDWFLQFLSVARLNPSSFQAPSLAILEIQMIFLKDTVKYRKSFIFSLDNSIALTTLT